MTEAGVGLGDLLGGVPSPNDRRRRLHLDQPVLGAPRDHILVVDHLVRTTLRTLRLGVPNQRVLAAQDFEVLVMSLTRV